jgi:pilus assembly protein CpaE
MLNSTADRELPPAGTAFGVQPHERPVPRISIHGFCEFPDTGAALQRAASDRRLSKAHVSVQLGGIDAALEHYSSQPTPNLLIIETRLQGKEAVKEIERLAEVCDAATKVIVAGRVNDVELYRDLMRRGISEYLVAPLDLLHLIEVISGLYLNPDAAPIGRVVSVVSCRGGVGSSTIAHNIGWCVADQMKINTTIVDLDLPFGTSSLDFNEEPGQGVADALMAPERLDDVLLERLLSKIGDHLSLLTSPAALERNYEADASTYEVVLDSVRRVSPCVIVDLPHMWTPWIRQTILASDEIVIVASPDLACLRNGKSIIDIAKQNRPNDVPPKLVLNLVGQPKRPEIPVKDFAQSVGLEPCVTLPYDPGLYGAAANAGQMLMQVKPNSPTADGIRQLSELITGRRPSEAQKSILPFMSLINKVRKQA